MPTFFKILIFLFIIVFIQSIEYIGIEINEVCTKNKHIIKDSYGNYSDWIELYNSGKESKDISNFGLSDNEDKLYRFKFPSKTIINPGMYLIIFASKQNSTQKEIHIGFSLKNEGDIIILSSPEGEIIEKLEIPFLEEDETYGKIFNGTLAKTIPTPGERNKIWIEPPSFSKNSGFYENEFLLLLSSPFEYDIYYTIDGSNPINSKTSTKYEEAIIVRDRTGEPNIYSEYEEDDDSPLSITLGQKYKKPNYLLDKPMIVRAISKNEYGHSKIIEKTYFITTENLSKYKDITVVSLVTNPENLFDAEKGIYVTGNQYIEWKNSDEYKPNKSPWDLNNKCNYFMRGKEWERDAHITIFEKSNILLEQNIGLRIKGSSTRNTQSKSFNIIARKKYGKSSIKCRLFESNYDKNGKIIEEYKSISLRQAHSDTRLRDKFTTDLFRKRNLTVAEMRTSVLFINGEYWGMYIIAEQFTSSFIESHYLIPKNDVAMVKQYNVEEGPESEYENFMSFAYKYSIKNLTETKDYMEVYNQVDFVSLMEHYAVGIYIGTTDWPGYNFGVWRNMGKKNEENEYSDGRWRLITYDLDKTLLNYSNDDWIHMEQRSTGTPAKLFTTLLQNNEFKKKFVNIFCDYANGIMSLDKVIALIEDYRENCTELIAYSQLRWSSYQDSKLEGYSYYKKRYLQALDNIYSFFKERKSYTFQHMKKYLNLTGEFHELTIIKKGNGKIKLNSIYPDMKDDKWIGTYISDYQITITAFSSTFKGWSGDISSEKETIKIKLEKDMIINVIF